MLLLILVLLLQLPLGMVLLVPPRLLLPLLIQQTTTELYLDALVILRCIFPILPSELHSLKRAWRMENATRAVLQDLPQALDQTQALYQTSALRPHRRVPCSDHPACRL